MKSHNQSTSSVAQFFETELNAFQSFMYENGEVKKNSHTKWRSFYDNQNDLVFTHKSASINFFNIHELTFNGNRSWNFVRSNSHHRTFKSSFFLQVDICKLAEPFERGAVDDHVCITTHFSNDDVDLELTDEGEVTDNLNTLIRKQHKIEIEQFTHEVLTALPLIKQSYLASYIAL
jgi:hypothetical protein